MLALVLCLRMYLTALLVWASGYVTCLPTTGDVMTARVVKKKPGEGSARKMFEKNSKNSL